MMDYKSAAECSSVPNGVPLQSLLRLTEFAMEHFLTFYTLVMLCCTA